MGENTKAHKKSEPQPLTLEEVIGWVEELQKRIDSIEKLLGQHGIEEPENYKWPEHGLSGDTLETLSGSPIQPG